MVLTQPTEPPVKTPPKNWVLSVGERDCGPLGLTESDLGCRFHREVSLSLTFGVFRA
jgi:hypothetical protein